MYKLFLLTLVLVLAVYAGAQQTINFADLPDVATATPLPTGYHSLTWSGVSYVDPFKATGMGRAFSTPAASRAQTWRSARVSVVAAAAIARPPRPVATTFNWSMRPWPLVTPADH